MNNDQITTELLNTEKKKKDYHLRKLIVYTISSLYLAFVSFLTLIIIGLVELLTDEMGTAVIIGLVMLVICMITGIVLTSFVLKHYRKYSNCQADGEEASQELSSKGAEEKEELVVPVATEGITI